MKTRALLICLISFSGLTLTSIGGETRTWNSTSGSKVDAELVSFSGSSVRLKTEKGRVISLQLNQLSEADQAFLKKTTEPPRGDEKAILSQKFKPGAWYEVHKRPGYEFVFEFKIEKESTITLAVPGGNKEKIGVAYSFTENDEVSAFSAQNRGALKITDKQTKSESTLRGSGGASGGVHNVTDGVVTLELENLSPHPITGVIWIYPPRQP